jgi:hypothetical protein
MNGILQRNMEKRYESLSLFKFQEQYPDNQSCYDHLAKLKWPEGFICEKCQHNHYCKGKLARTRQCTKCGYQATPTSGTLFHKVKFPILKAFYIVYFMSTNKQGISSTELSRKLGLRQKTCWAFKQKVMKAMASSLQHPMLGKVEVDETVVGQQEEGTKGRQNENKKLVVVAIARAGKGIGRMYANKSLKPFFKDHIDPKAEIKTDQWRGYTPLKHGFPNLEQIPSGTKGGNFHDMHRVIMMLKTWLRGTHHSVKHLQGYLDEYCYRFNRHLMREKIFDNMMHRMIKHSPIFNNHLNIA